jgi:hypothetical protein
MPIARRIRHQRLVLLLIIVVLIMPFDGRLAAQKTRKVTDAELANAKPGRDPNQPIDEEYTRKIKRYTTETFFLSPLVDYLPASKTVPTPAAVLGDIAGAEGKLPYTKEIYEYLRLLAKSTPRVKVYSIGTSEEGREMLAVAVASEALMSKLDQNKADLAKLADPRTIKMDDEVADEIARRAAPIYYITGTIHALVWLSTTASTSATSANTSSRSLRPWSSRTGAIAWSTRTNGGRSTQKTRR